MLERPASRAVIQRVVDMVAEELCLEKESREYDVLVNNTVMFSLAFPAEQKLLDVTIRASRQLLKRNDPSSAASDSPTT
jgi:hypothetical protein